jgi:hypothetical protein
VRKSTLWFLSLFIATITISHLELGWFGLLGFPIISVIYAIMKKDKAPKSE